MIDSCAHDAQSAGTISSLPDYGTRNGIEPNVPEVDGAVPRSISIVTSLYNSAPYIFEFYHRTKATVDRLGLDYEFIFVDDGSPDDSAAKVTRLRETDARVHVIRLSRNHGQQRAMLAGLHHASGDLVFAVDVDLEEQPEDLATLIEAMRLGGAAVAFGVMKQRHGGFARSTLGRLFHRAMSRLASTEIPENQLWSRVMTRQFVREACRFHEHHLYLGGIFQLVGFPQVAVPLDKSFKQSSSYSAWKRLIAAIDALTSFSVAPLYALCIVGLGVVVVCGLLATAIIIQKLVFGVTIQGWTTLAVLLLSFMGVGMLTQGILGIYVGKIFAQVKQRPLYIIRSTTLASNDGGEPADQTSKELSLRA
jgi:putative glycosyltransferase